MRFSSEPHHSNRFRRIFSPTAPEKLAAARLDCRRSELAPKVEKLDDIKKPEKAGEEVQTREACYSCGKPGHTAKQCRLPKKFQPIPKGNGKGAKGVKNPTVSKEAQGGNKSFRCGSTEHVIADYTVGKVKFVKKTNGRSQ